MLATLEAVEAVGLDEVVLVDVVVVLVVAPEAVVAGFKFSLKACSMFRATFCRADPSSCDATLEDT